MYWKCIAKGWEMNFSHPLNARLSFTPRPELRRRKTYPVCEVKMGKSFQVFPSLKRFWIYIHFDCMKLKAFRFLFPRLMHGERDNESALSLSNDLSYPLTHLVSLWLVI